MDDQGETFLGFLEMIFELLDFFPVCLELVGYLLGYIYSCRVQDGLF